MRQRHKISPYPPLLEVTQLDREAAALSFELDGIGGKANLPNDIRAGKFDHLSRVQVFARHRLDVLATAGEGDKA